MNINKIDNGYTVHYQTSNVKTDGSPDWDDAYTHHTYAFANWTDLSVWIMDNEKKCDD